MSIRDVIVHTNINTFAFPSSKTLETNPPPPDPFKLSDELWIGRIEADAARIVLDLGEPAYYGTPKPVTQYAQLYSFVREKDRLAAPYQWDEDARLQACVAVSRLIQPTTVSLRYAARIRYNPDSIADISPANIRGVGIDTFPASPPARDWLTKADAMRLREALKRLNASPMPDRASRALWYHEYAVRTYYVEIRWVLVSTALEALIHVGKRDSGRQFKCRVSQLANELGILGFGGGEAERAWSHRSTLAHGQTLGQLSEPDRRLYELMETTLRLAILRAIEEVQFAAALKDEEEIKKRWTL